MGRYACLKPHATGEGQIVGKRDGQHPIGEDVGDGSNLHKEGEQGRERPRPAVYTKPTGVGSELPYFVGGGHERRCEQRCRPPAAPFACRRRAAAPAAPHWRCPPAVTRRRWAAAAPWPPPQAPHWSAAAPSGPARTGQVAVRQQQQMPQQQHARHHQHHRHSQQHTCRVMSSTTKAASSARVMAKPARMARRAVSGQRAPSALLTRTEAAMERPKTREKLRGGSGWRGGRQARKPVGHAALP